jgi:hypothetical protein
MKPIRFIVEPPDNDLADKLKFDPRTSSILARFFELREAIHVTVCLEGFPEYHFPEHRVPTTRQSYDFIRPSRAFRIPESQPGPIR